MPIHKNEAIIQAPRNVIVLLVQYLAIVPFGGAFVLILVPLLSRFPRNNYDAILLILLILPFLIIGSALLYFPEKYRTSCVYDKGNNLLRKVKNNKDILVCDLNGVNSILLRIMKEYIGVRIEVLLEEANDNIELYCENNYLNYTQWIAFAKKLSKVTSLPLKEDFRQFSNFRGL
jgi:hypothetical protein